MTEKAFKTTEINSTLIKSKQLLNFEHLLNTIKLTGPGPASHRNHLTLNALPKAPFRLAKQPISQAQTAHTAAHGATARNQAGCKPHNITHADFYANPPERGRHVGANAGGFENPRRLPRQAGHIID